MTKPRPRNSVAISEDRKCELLPGYNLNKAVATCGFKLIQVSVSVYSHGHMLNFRHSCQKFHVAKNNETILNRWVLFKIVSGWKT